MFFREKVAVMSVTPVRSNRKVAINDSVSMEFVVTNIGDKETGFLTVSPAISPFIRLSTSPIISSLQPGDKSTVILTVTPNSNVTLGKTCYL